MYSLDDYTYTLPESLIAQTPADPPESCKFLVYTKHDKTIKDHIFSDITALIDPDTLIIFNNTKVVQARLLFTHQQTSKPCEIFYLSSLNTHSFIGLVRPGKRFKVGETIYMTNDISFKIDAMTQDGRQLTCSHPILDVLATYGKMPLPPYISYDESKADPYQPVFAEKAGSVAAPTASLHFTTSLIQQLEQQGIQTIYTTLHVGLGTFKQVDVEHIEQYDIHAETVEIDVTLFERIARHKKVGKPLLAVGTTVTRTLESLPYVRTLLSDSLYDNDVCTYRDTLTKDMSLEKTHEYIHNLVVCDNQISFETKLFLYPGKPLYVIDELITNFHLPKSSLLMLVAAFIGYDTMKQIYSHAIDHSYRFYSFGDAMWLK